MFFSDHERNGMQHDLAEEKDTSVSKLYLGRKYVISWVCLDIV
jgi:hypothetical protein